uniref:Cystatin domain-containing protein n=1 Tax=Leersia perrieri TaxID=77586 RepID=A0A0D9V9G7_9ORYZ
MATRATALLLVLVVVACAAAAAAKSPSGGGIRKVVGGRTEVRDVEGNKEVQELGRFSVEEHNRRRGRVEEENSCCGGDGDVGVRLEFGRVIAAQRQVVSGLKYYLRVAAAEESGSGAGQGSHGVVCCT